MSARKKQQKRPYRIPDYVENGKAMAPNVLQIEADLGYNSLDNDGHITKHAPTEGSEDLVRMLAMAGCSEKRISEVFGLPLPLFQKHYDKHVKIGAMIPVTNVMKNLYVAAIKPGGDVKAASTFLQVATKGPGWKEPEKEATATGIVCEIKLSNSE